MKHVAGLISLLLLLHVPLYAAEMKTEKNPVVRLSVLTSGKVLLNGKESNLPDVKEALEKARSEKAVVWYYRESGKSEPPRQAMEVIKLVIENNLPISMSSKPDFSDYIDDKGQSRPRK
jgi:biopolymer transport protein ExbD